MSVRCPHCDHGVQTEPGYCDNGCAPADNDREFWHGLSAAKGEPYTVAEWKERVAHLNDQIRDAKDRYAQALVNGVCLPARFDKETTVGANAESESVRLAMGRASTAKRAGDQP